MGAGLRSSKHVIQLVNETFRNHLASGDFIFLRGPSVVHGQGSSEKEGILRLAVLAVEIRKRPIASLDLLANIPMGLVFHQGPSEIMRLIISVQRVERPACDWQFLYY